MGQLMITDELQYKREITKTCSKCSAPYKPHTIIGQRKSCRVHNFIDGYCIDCHLKTNDIKGKNCRHIPGFACCNC